MSRSNFRFLQEEWKIMGLRDSEAVMGVHQGLERSDLFQGSWWAPDEPHGHEAFIPLNSSVYDMAVLGAVKTLYSADYSQSLATISGRIDALSSAIATLNAQLS